MAIRRRRTTKPPMETEQIKETLDQVEVHSKVDTITEQPTPSVEVEKTNKVFLGEEDKKLMKKFTQHIVNKLKLSGTRSYKV